MNSKITIGIVVLLACGAFYYQYTKTEEIRQSLVALNKDRESLNRKIASLNQQVADAKDREEAAAAVAEATRSLPAAPAVAVKRADEPPPPGVTRSAPAGWAKNGSKPGAYFVGVDQNNSFGGLPSAYVKSIDSSVDGFGGMMQTISAEDYVGKRVRLSGWMKTEDANEGGGHLWLRVDGQGSSPQQFDNMSNRAPKGTTDWQQYSVVLDVPQDSRALAYGFFVQGGGQVWVSGQKIEAVGADVPSTNMVGQQRALPKAPTNLSFDPNAPK